MSAVLLPSSAAARPAPSTAIAPRERAGQFHQLIREIEEAMGESATIVEEIRDRGALRNLFSSSRDDLVAHASGQNRVNTLLLKLQREAIKLNTLGYAYLTSLIAEFERQVNEGVRDSDGKIHVLSSNGKEVAQMAKEMFNAILDTSESTQARIEANTATLAEHDQRLTEVANGLVEAAERAAIFEQFRLTSAEAFKTLERQNAELLGGLQAHARERAAMRDQLSQASEREARLQRQLRRSLWIISTSAAATAALSLVATARAFGWF